MAQHQFGKKSGYIQPTLTAANKSEGENTKTASEKNSGNFKNDPERAAEAGRKGGKSSHKGENNK